MSDNYVKFTCECFSAYACMYMCMSMCLCVCVCACVHACMRVCVHACVYHYTCMHIRTYFMLQVVVSCKVDACSFYADIKKQLLTI